ncbi:class I SAM-dependent methyltransferase [Phnomibacter sp. MR]|uniref:class I SAM-dependent methyltransferase n=1 Tax=Phnomibacter sp. MR TaxID=3042318 RepID=UPI003A81156D
MSNLEIELIKEMLSQGLIQSPVLELGVSYDVDFIMKDEFAKVGIEYFGTDLHAGKDVDFVINFEDNITTIREQYPKMPSFNCILILNVLEHTYNPIKVMQNALQLLNEGGLLITSTPSVFPIHNYPIDVYRLLPDFYTEFAKREKVTLLHEYFRFLGYGKIDQYLVNNQLSYPKPWRSKTHEWRSRLVHKIFNTSGRGMMIPNHISISSVFKK